MPGGCVPNALPVENDLGLPWAPDVLRLLEALRGLLAEEQAEEGGMTAVEEEDKEEQRGPLASGAAPM